MSAGYDAENARRSFSLNARCYTDPQFLSFEQKSIFTNSWQWVCHIERLREPGAYFVADVHGRSIAVVRAMDGNLRGFYNVCQHRAHALLAGEGNINVITCPYHAWTYALDGRLVNAPMTQHLDNFDKNEICLSGVQVEEFCGFVYVNLEPDAESLASQSGDLKNEIEEFAPDVERLTFAH
ncbi:MAG: Rieske (2Fe-2S) protein, partial [Nitrospinae bacterium]|nr:Rieske (2Fe-2S) protein [Nitrospinota bacterium]